MRILIFALFISLSFSACKKQQEGVDTAPVEQNKNSLVTEQDIAKLKYTEYVLDEKAENIIKNSGEYVQLRDFRANVKKGDLSFFGDNQDTSKALFKNLRQTLPSTFNTESILARILVLETKFYKLESLSGLSTTTKTELLETIKEFLVAFSNLNLQMNKKVEFDNRSIEKPSA